MTLSSQARQGLRLVRRAARRWARRMNGRSARPTTDPSALYAIGLYAGRSPLELAPARGLVNPVLTAKDVTDMKAWFVADPFMLPRGGRWHLFFEVLNLATMKGDLALATSDDGFRWRYERCVLSEPFHLSYPQVLEWEGETWMIPETHQAGEVRLYRADPFPHVWKLEAVLLRGTCLNDATVFRHEERWWMFVENSELRHDTLRLFSADALRGPWIEHPASPLVRGNPHHARPAGPVIRHEGRLIRTAQDCHPAYGLRVHTFEVTALSTSHYAEQPVGRGPLLAASGWGWNRCGMHHCDAHRLADGSWIACVDGWHDANDPLWTD